jgi:hypothetical protein
LIKSIEQCQSILNAKSTWKTLTKSEPNATQNRMAEEKQVTGKAIVTLSTACMLATEAQKRKYRNTNKPTAETKVCEQASTKCKIRKNQLTL